MKKRPIGVTILAILAGLVAVMAAIHALQALGILPIMLGQFKVRAFDFWEFLLWALVVWVYVWLIQMLWRVDKMAWLFLVMLTGINLMFDFMSMAGTAEWADVKVSFLLNAVILVYVMLPGVRKAFDVD